MATDNLVSRRLATAGARMVAGTANSSDLWGTSGSGFFVQKPHTSWHVDGSQTQPTSFFPPSRPFSTGSMKKAERMPALGSAAPALRNPGRSVEVAEARLVGMIRTAHAAPQAGLRQHNKSDPLARAKEVVRVGEYRTETFYHPTKPFWRTAREANRSDGSRGTLYMVRLHRPRGFVGLPRCHPRMRLLRRWITPMAMTGRPRLTAARPRHSCPGCARATPPCVALMHELSPFVLVHTAPASDRVALV
jgi:hypothetical protein